MTELHDAALCRTLRGGGHRVAGATMRALMVLLDDPQSGERDTLHHQQTQRRDEQVRHVGLGHVRVGDVDPEPCADNPPPLRKVTMASNSARY